MGAGALGSVLGALLSRKNDVLLITRGKHLENIREKGLEVRGHTSGIFYLDALNYYPGGADLIISSVKAHQTEEAKKIMMKEYAGEPVITFQNGVGIIELLEPLDVIPGVITHGATLLSPGVVLHAGYGDTYIGEIHGKRRERVVKIAENFTSSGLRTEVVYDIMKRRWLKAGVNAIINSLTSILSVKNGAIIESENLRNIVRCMASEINATLRERGIEEDVYPLAIDVAKKTRDNKSSMLQDIENGKRTEVDYIIKPFVREDCMSMIYHLVKFLESGV